MQNFIDGFVSYLSVECSRSPRTVVRYRQNARAYLELLTKAGQEPSTATRSTIRCFLAGHVASRSGWNNRLAALRAFYEYLRVDHGVAFDPSHDLSKQRVYAAERVPLTMSEMVALVEAAGEGVGENLGARNGAIVLVLLHTALRVSELVGLNISQLDLQGGHLLAVRTKGAKKISLPLSRLVTDALVTYLALRGALLNGREQQALFVSMRGSRLSVRAVQELVHRAATLTGIGRPVTPHLLRHSAATALADLTGLRVVQEILGHSSLAVTQTYLAVRPTDRRVAIEALASRWEQAMSSASGRAD